MQKKHFSAMLGVILLLLICNFGGIFAFLNNWAFDHMVRIGPGKPISSEIVAIRVRANNDYEALVAKVQQLEFKSLTVLMLNQSGTLTSYIFSSKEDALQFKSEVKPPDSLTWRGPDEIGNLAEKLTATLKQPVEVGSDVWLDFGYRNQEIEQLEAHEILSQDFDTDLLKNKIVIIGDHFSSQTRFFSTPIHQGSRALTALSREVLLIDSGLRNGWVKVIPSKVSLVFAILTIFGLIIANTKMPGGIRFKRLTAILVTSFSLATLLLLKLGHVWFPPAQILFSITATSMILYLASYHELKKTLSKVLDHVISHPTRGVFVYGSAGELKYYSNEANCFLKDKFNIELIGLNRNQLLAELTQLNPTRVERVFRKAAKQRYYETGLRVDPIRIRDEVYDISIQPLDKHGMPESTDFLITIEDFDGQYRDNVDSEPKKTILSHFLTYPLSKPKTLAKQR